MGEIMLGRIGDLTEHLADAGDTITADRAD
jgi:hypothetical protein